MVSALSRPVNWCYRFRRVFAFVGALMCLLSLIPASAFAVDDATTDAVDQMLGVMDKFADKAIGSNGIGAKVIAFVTSSPLLMIGMACFILVMLVGMVRRFLTGV